MPTINGQTYFQITVPFVFQATVILPRCRKATTAYVRDDLTLFIPDVPVLPVAASWDEHDLKTGTPVNHRLYFANDNFWMDLRLSNSGQASESMNCQAFRELVNKPRNYGNPFGGHERWSSRDAQQRLESLPYRADLNSQVRTWVTDERDEEVRRLHRIAEDYLVSGGRMYKKSLEYVYHVMTFGLGNNHGGIGTILTLANRAEAVQRCTRECIFSLNDLDAAIAKANEVATRRGDTKSLPILPDYQAHVAMPQVFTPTHELFKQSDAVPAPTGHVTDIRTGAV